jgi:hypothetical protein
MHCCDCETCQESGHSVDMKGRYNRERASVIGSSAIYSVEAPVGIVNVLAVRFHESLL